MIEANKTVVRRLVAEVLNGGRLEVIDELYAPELVPAARGWIGPFRASFPDLHMEIVELIAEGDKVRAAGAVRGCLPATKHRATPILERGGGGHAPATCPGVVINLC